ncbi:MAG: hypothetical protein RR639_07330 [Hydrogenoanaerobacterium sp.]
MKTNNIPKKMSDKQEKKIRQLYVLIWFLICPLAYMLAVVLKFKEINIVYWTLLAVPLFLAIYNVRQVPHVAVKEKPQPPVPEFNSAAMDGTALDGGAAVKSQDEPPANETEQHEQTADDMMRDGVSRTQHLKFLAQALKAPVIIALPLLITVIAALFIK